MANTEALAGAVAQEQPQTDPLRRALRQMWAAAAPSWSLHADAVDARTMPTTRAMLHAVAPRRGERVLELACGPGGVGLEAAELVGPRGRVVLSDVSVEMTAIAAARANARGLRNVTTCELDLEQIDQPRASFDVIVCREGLMLVPDPERALAEIHRVLRPGGRVAVAVWAEPQHNPWLAILFDAVGRHTGAVIPPAGIPRPFSLADAGHLRTLLSDAGLTDLTVTPVPSPLHAASFEEWWDVVASLAGPMAGVLAGQPDHVREAIRSTTSEALSAFSTPNGYAIPGLSLVGGARKP